MPHNPVVNSVEILNIKRRKRECFCKPGHVDCMHSVMEQTKFYFKLSQFLQKEFTLAAASVRYIAGVEMK